MLSVLISCLYNRLKNIETIIQGPVPNVEYIIVVQGAIEEELDAFRHNNNWTDRSDLKIILDSNVGVTHSRNLAIKHASGEYALFTDDDVTLSDNYVRLLSDSFSQFPEYDFFTFNVEDENGDLLKLPLSKGEHTRRTILGVGTIQIAVRLNSQTVTYQFPLELGAGAKYPCCDEPVYLSLFLNKGHKGRHIDKTICQHPKESSGSSLNSYAKITSRFIAFNYIFGRTLGVILFLAFILKNIKKILVK
ncbi:glycosyltransferase family A protein [Pseudoalteromonas distincta]|uniref:glycosyltransferase family A protein n=1 Tax=Pseudoalteromonas distincta TaxID=77608 RepID=UPI00020A0262|nr:glycosyltransferase family A protein [Pseudoalteromonas distincta]EGI74697.1 hypothetical protein PH505_ae00980 [Pseudoalteromonas distincta]